MRGSSVPFSVHHLVFAGGRRGGGCSPFECRLAKTNPHFGRGPAEEEEMDDEVLDELLGRIETLEEENTRLRKARKQSKVLSGDFSKCLPTS